MYICNCMGITEREIRGAVDLGCETVADLGRDLGVGTCCGKCVPEAGSLLRRCCAIQAAGQAACGD
ncbi:MAG TPA: (2Fe-2S)-binding protein [Usitatibacter sp.]|jgi:bacterioferritin-associated ferredoxin|nr:(2Fe-2S)-binding protein [Usitatibacter sp.]